MPASSYTRAMINNSQLRGAAFTVPSAVYVALHTASPGVDGVLNEVSTGAWPSYARRDCANGGAISTGWTEDSGSGLSQNAQQIIFAAHNGAAPITISHWSLWDSAVGGNCLDTGSLATPRTLEVGEVLVIDPGKLTRQLT